MCRLSGNFPHEALIFRGESSQGQRGRVRGWSPQRDPRGGEAFVQGCVCVSCACWLSMCVRALFFVSVHVNTRASRASTFSGSEQQV